MSEAVVSGRPYSGSADLQRMIRFLVEARARNPVQRWHPGDVVWRMYCSSGFDAARCVRLWEDQHGEVVGFGWLYPPDGADLVPRDPDLLPEMIAWAESCVADGTLYLATLDVNHDENAVLEAQRFERTELYGYHLLRRIDGDIPGWTLPLGFTLRPLAGDDEIEARALVNQQAFGTQHVTIDGYRNVTRTPLYERDLDLVVVAPDGRLAAFCLGWLDEADRVGLFEPVGTHPEFRRMGLARAAMLEALRRMHRRGIESALVATGAENVASVALYTSLGFAVSCRELVYRRERSTP